MSSTVLYMSISLDGFIAGPNAGMDNGLGDGGQRLHDWVVPEPETGVNRRIVDEFMSTGAVVGGRGPVAPAGRSSSSPATSPASTSRAGPWSRTSTT